MDVLVYKGKKYIRPGKQWADETGLVQPEIIQAELNRIYEQQVSYEGMTFDEIVSLGDKYKATHSLGLARNAYREAFCTATVHQVKYLLPRITSLYRQMGQPQEVIDILAEASATFGQSVISVPLLTSAAAAYCDMGDLKRAKKACDRAYALSGGIGAGELASVYSRIRMLLSGSSGD